MRSAVSHSGGSAASAGRVASEAADARDAVTRVQASTSSRVRRSDVRRERVGDVARVVADDASFDPARLRAGLGRALPGYMIPQRFVRKRSLPRRANGKLARESLTAPMEETTATTAGEPPRTELERVLVELWRDVLQTDSLGVHDDFFAAGGHSLLATRLISRIRDRLGVEIALIEFFANPTVAAFATVVAAQREADEVPGIGAIPRASRRIGGLPDGAEG